MNSSAFMVFLMNVMGLINARNMEHIKLQNTNYVFLT